MSKLKCPINNCPTEPSNIARLWDHFRGKHLGKYDLKELLMLISDSSKIDEKTKKGLVQRIQGFLYEPSGEDILILLDDDRASNIKTNSYSLNLFFDLNKPVCREERQYSLFFANYLKKDNKDLNQILGFHSCKISEVYYESTFMRDYWFQNKEEFNKTLWGYLEKKENEFKNKNYKNTEKHPNHWEDSIKHPLASWMMNAKPDIAVLLQKNDKFILSYLECKYFSEEDVYTNPGTRIVKNQTELQEDILDFLCNEIGLRYNNEVVSKGDVKLVRFTNDSLRPTKKSQKEITIPIEDLIKHGYR